MKKTSKLLAIIAASLLYTSSTFAVAYNYTTLIFKDYPDLKPLVNNALRESRRFKYPQDGIKPISPLKISLKMILSRPDSDDLVSKLSPDLIGDLESMGVFETVVEELINEGRDEVFNKALSPKVRTTSLIMLNNLLLLIRPLTIDNIKLAGSVCKFADTNIKIPQEILQNSKLTTMLKGSSPTNLAKKIMLWYAKQKNRAVQSSKKGCPFSKRA